MTTTPNTPQTPREQLEAAIEMKATKWRSQYSTSGIQVNASTEAKVHAILAVFKGLPAMQKKPENSLDPLAYIENAKIDQILAELDGGK